MSQTETRPLDQLRSSSHEREYFATMAANGKVANGKVADGKASNGRVANGKASNGNVSVESSKGPWAECAACSAQGPRPQNEDVHVMLCSGLPEGPAPNIKAAGLPGLFDDLPEMVSGPSLPEKVSDHSERCPEWLGGGFRMFIFFSKFNGNWDDDDDDAGYPSLRVGWCFHFYLAPPLVTREWPVVI